MRIVISVMAVMLILVAISPTYSAKRKAAANEWQVLELPEGASIKDTWLLSDTDNLFGWMGNAYYSIEGDQISKLDFKDYVTIPEKTVVYSAGRLILSRKDKSKNTLGYIKGGKFVDLESGEGKRVVFNDGTCRLDGCASGDPMSPYMTFQVNDRSRCVLIYFAGKGITLMTPPEGFNYGRVGRIGDEPALFQYFGPCWVYRDGKPQKLTMKDGSAFKCKGPEHAIKTAGNYFSFIREGENSPTYFVDGKVIRKVEAGKAHNLFSIGESTFLMAGDSWPISLYKLSKGKAKRHSPANRVVGNFANWFDGRGKFGVGAKWGDNGGIMIKLSEKKSQDITLPKDHRKFSMTGVQRAVDDREEFVVQSQTDAGVVPMFVDDDGKLSVLRDDKKQVLAYRYVRVGFGKTGTYMIVSDGETQKLLYRPRTDKNK